MAADIQELEARERRKREWSVLKGKRQEGRDRS